jgi:hypothetical protein
MLCWAPADVATLMLNVPCYDFTLYVQLPANKRSVSVSVLRGWLWCLDQLQCALKVGSGVYSTSATVCSGGWFGCLDQL